MASNAETPVQSTTVLGGRSLTAVREATAEAIDPRTYQPLARNEERYYLVAIAETHDVGDWTPQHTAIYATADGYRATTRRWGCAPVPHAISVYFGTAPLATDVLETEPDALAEIIARAHPEVSR